MKRLYHDPHAAPGDQWLRQAPETAACAFGDGRLPQRHHPLVILDAIARRAGPDRLGDEAWGKMAVQIEELAGALERCRKTAPASKAAMALGGILLAATLVEDAPQIGRSED